MLLGSDLAAALSTSGSSRGTSSPATAEPGSPLGGASPALLRRIRFRQTPQRSPLPPNRTSASIWRPSNDCRHFHYETVELGPVRVDLEDEKLEDGRKTAEFLDCQKPLRLTVESNGKHWQISRTMTELCQLDCQLHRCIFSREHSRLEESDYSLAQLRNYLQRLSLLTGSLMRCYSVLSFFELDNRGNHFHPAEYSQINTPAIACAVAVRPFAAQHDDHLELHVGDIVSVVEMAEGADWWRGKLTVPTARAVANGKGKEQKELPVEDAGTNKVGSFPANCVRLFSDRLSLGEQIWLASQPKPGVRRNSTGARRLLSPFSSPTPRLKSLLRLATFSPGDGPFGRELTGFGGVPALVTECMALIERQGMVPGVYRQCGVQSNIRRLRREFCHNQTPQWDSPQMTLLLQNDIHSVPSLLKQFFRQLPDPLLSFKIHPRLIAIFTEVENRPEQVRLAKVHELLDDLPAAHFLTARSLFAHLQRISRHRLTEMSARNLAIVWAPNLLRCPPAQVADWPNQLAGLDLHTEICAFLIENVDALFGNDETGKENQQDEKITTKLEEKAKSTPQQRRKRNSLICTAANGAVQPIEDAKANGTLGVPERQSKRDKGAHNVGEGARRQSLRQLIHNTSVSLEHSFNTLLRRPAGGSPSERQPLTASQRSHSMDRSKEKRAQRLLTPFSASVMRRVRSVRKSVQKLRPSSTASPRATAQNQPDEANGIPFVDDPQVASTSSASDHDSVAETVKECADHDAAGRRVIFGAEEAEAARDGTESVDSMPLDVSRYDNVQSSLLATRDAGKQGRLCTTANSREVTRLKAKLRPLSLADTEDDDGESNEQNAKGTIYF